jgi:exopolysaccharide biosynthesis predicted pyruvyltransferase EpsI
LDSTRNLSVFRLKRGLDIIRNCESVTTDRLHGVILSQLLGKKVFAVNNSNGKIFNYFGTWTDYLEKVEVLDTSGLEDKANGLRNPSKGKMNDSIEDSK